MSIYKQLYFFLFNATTKAIEQLQLAQQESETKFMEQAEDTSSQEEE